MRIFGIKSGNNPEDFKKIDEHQLEIEINNIINRSLYKKYIAFIFLVGSKEKQDYYNVVAIPKKIKDQVTYDNFITWWISSAINDIREDRFLKSYKEKPHFDYHYNWSFVVCNSLKEMKKDPSFKEILDIDRVWCLYVKNILT